MIEKSIIWLGDKPRAIKTLRSISEVLVDGYYTIGLTGLATANYLESKIKIATYKKTQSNLFKDPKTISLVYKYLICDGKSNGRYTELYISDVLSKIYNKVGIKKKSVAADINRFYVADRTTVSNQKGFVLKRKRFK